MVEFKLRETTVELLEFFTKADGPWVPTLRKRLQEKVFQEIMEQIIPEERQDSEK